jgi:sugar lactone lactonase YvrE
MTWIHTLTARWLLLFGLAGALMAQQATHIYWTGNGAITGANIDGTEPQTVVDGLPGLVGLYDLAVDSEQGKLYFAHKAQYMIERVNLDGSQRETLIGESYPVGLALDADAQRIYWTDYTNANPRIRRANIDGSDVEDLFTASSGCDLSGIVLDPGAGHLYWAERMDQQIWRGNLAGGGATLVLQCWAGIGHPWGLALAGGRIYWTVGGIHGNAIVSANTDGSDVQTLVSDLPQPPRSLEFDATSQRLYWVSNSTAMDGLVQSVLLDGSGLETLASGVRYGYGLALGSFETGSAGPPVTLRPAILEIQALQPNPFNPGTTLAFRSRAAGPLTLTVHDLLGRKLSALSLGHLPAGEHRIAWQGQDFAGRPLASGSYLLQLRHGDGSVATVRGLLLR